MGIAPIELVLSKIAVTVAFFFEDSAGGPYRPDETALSPPISTNLFQAPDGFGSRKHSCEYRNLRRASA
jgi:hypothetical protein